MVGFTDSRSIVLQLVSQLYDSCCHIANQGAADLIARPEDLNSSSWRSMRVEIVCATHEVVTCLERLDAHFFGSSSLDPEPFDRIGQMSGSVLRHREQQLGYNASNEVIRRLSCLPSSYSRVHNQAGGIGNYLGSRPRINIHTSLSGLYRDPTQPPDQVRLYRL